ncbi:hypothetical protein PGB90_002552 [Kerria lacca]
MGEETYMNHHSINYMTFFAHIPDLVLKSFNKIYGNKHLSQILHFEKFQSLKSSNRIWKKKIKK